MNRLTTTDRVAVVRALVEGCSIRSTVRMTGVSKNTVTKLLVEMGQACSEYQDRVMRNLPCKRLQLDEIWSFVYCKAKNIPAEKANENVGDVWTWTAICADTKLIPSWHVGARDGESARDFCNDLASRLTGRVQLTSDGHGAYLDAVHGAFGYDVDYAMLVKIYGQVQTEGERRYTPSGFVGSRKRRVMGDPDARHVSTSFVERANLTMRMSMRRFTRLTNAFSKKIENHVAALSLYFMYYNFCRVHQTLRSTPAMKAGVADHLWTIEEMVGLLPELKYDTRPEKKQKGLN